MRVLFVGELRGRDMFLTLKLCDALIRASEPVKRTGRYLKPVRATARALKPVERTGPEPVI